jgi:glycosyltransferase involved in cell wall biosynthesis
MARVVFTVTNDVFTDQRVNKMAKTLFEMGFLPSIIGVKRKDSQAFNPPYARVKRVPLLFHKGFLFYAEYNLKLFFILLFSRFSLIIANDLDTLLPAHLASRIRGKNLVYDTHEYFTGTPEVIDRPRVHRVWKSLEKWLFPRQKTVITVNESIARLYREEYGNTVRVVRNLPPTLGNPDILSREELGVPAGTRILLMQGSGINVERGAEELVAAMHPAHGLENVQLWIIGGGDVIRVLKEAVMENGLENRVRFFPRMPYRRLMAHTALADIGLSLDRDRSINYRFSLPNKLFDYIMAGVPVLASDLPEVKKIVMGYGVGRTLTTHEPSGIARALAEMLSDDARMEGWRNSCLQARKTLCWEEEEKIVREIYRDFLV